MLLTASALAEVTDATEIAEGAVGAVRRLAVASLLPGVGVSTLTAQLATTFARHRSGRVLVAERSAGHAATMLSDVALFGDSTARGIDTLTLDPSSSWREQVAPRARHFDVVLTDSGPMAGVSDLAATAQAAHALCIVTSDTRAVAENAIAIARGLHLNPDAPRVVVAFVDTGNLRSTWPALVGSRLPFPVTRIPHDRALAARQTAPRSTAGTALRTATRRGVLLTAAALFRQSEPGMSR